MSCEITENLENECPFSKFSVTSPTSQLILQPFFRFSYVTGSSPTSPGEPPMVFIESRIKDLLILQPFRHFTYVIAHSPTFPSLHLRHNSFFNHSVALPTSHSFSNPSVASPTSQLILKPFFRFSYVTGSSLTSRGEPPVVFIESRVKALLILQPFRHFTYVTAHSPTLPSLYLRHSPFSSPSVASPTSQFILQPLFRFSYVTSSSLNSPGEPPMCVILQHKKEIIQNMNSIDILVSEILIF